MAETFDSAAEAIEAWEDDNGVELDDEQFEHLTRLVEQTADAEGEATVADVVDRWQAEQDEPDQHEQDNEPDQPDPFTRDVAAEYERLESKLGRKLTQREVDAVAERLAEQAVRFDDISAEAALDDYHEQGGRKYDLDNAQDRRAWMTERIQDRRAAEQPEDDDREYDLDNRTDRVDYMAQRHSGQEFEDIEVPDEAA